MPPLENSDHDIVLIDLANQVVRTKPTKRTIYLWKKAEITKINERLRHNFDNFQQMQFSVEIACGVE